MTTFSSAWPATHPWFAHSMKRKHSETPSSGSEGSDSSGAESTSSSHRAKRCRYSQLARTMSGLSLAHSSSSTLRTHNAPGQPTISELGIPRDDIPMIQPSQIDEPKEVTPPPPEASTSDVKMKSWYEPEPDRTRLPPAFMRAARSADRASGIVVTDLDSSDDEDGPAVEAELISPALMEHIRRQGLRSGLLPTDSHSQALVLYRPVPLPDTESEDADDDNIEAPTPMSISEAEDADPLDSDAMDIDD
ncbi:hypothetical protein CYLTODRAFT_133 [Cylindrobasidium torrendii FP15055 ss-10]|uniref:Uncharacterized protein n=1 Tax=Cylindrobasidium torrendii FP15055 ss-10 TaxID=1314674 RepID=A0A0D7BUR5_9AGAR|nr:hypothetical protein CYLTODRAFT_133 [Cylindrobasidium torrendii FP15055 ss-10]